MKAPDAKGVALIIGAIGTTLWVPIGFKTAGCPDWIVAMALAAAVLMVLTCLRRLVVPADPAIPTAETSRALVVRRDREDRTVTALKASPNDGEGEGK